MPLFHVIIPAAGVGTRMANAIPKQYLTLAGEPLIFHVIRVFINNPRIAGVHIALNKDDDLWRSFNINADARLHIHHTGGGARSETVSNTLQALEANEQDWVLVHDAARPGLSAALLTQLLDQLQNDEVGGLLAMPVADTLKKSDVNNHIEHTVSRQNLWQAQTPQMFRYNQLKQALADFDGLPTDEAEAIEAQGLKPILVQGELPNLKVTFPQDLALLELVFEKQKE